jgi:hypothetical protein
MFFLVNDGLILKSTAYLAYTAVNIMWIYETITQEYSFGVFCISRKLKILSRELTKSVIMTPELLI